jgi:hypothetical protein
MWPRNERAVHGRLFLARRAPAKALVFAIVCAALTWTAAPAAAGSLRSHGSEDPGQVPAVSSGGDSIAVLGDDGGSGGAGDDGAGSSGYAGSTSDDDDDATEENGANGAEHVGAAPGGSGAGDVPGSGAAPASPDISLFASWFALCCDRPYVGLG